METKIQMTPIHSLLVVTKGDETRIYILTKKNGKEVRAFYSERLLHKVQDWDNLELEAHIEALSYSYKVILGNDLAGDLLTGKYIPGEEVSGYEVIRA
jgi:hypothetical protein